MLAIDLVREMPAPVRRLIRAELGRFLGLELGREVALLGARRCLACYELVQGRGLVSGEQGVTRFERAGSQRLSYPLPGKVSDDADFLGEILAHPTPVFAELRPFQPVTNRLVRNASLSRRNGYTHKVSSHHDGQLLLAGVTAAFGHLT